MGTVIKFLARRHTRASSAVSRAAKRVRRSDVTPALDAISVAITRDHHSDGMLSRFHHLITDQLLAPTSDAIASREPHKSMTDRNEVKSDSDIPLFMGLTVPEIKAIVSHDSENRSGHNVPMDRNEQELAETAWREAFRQRLRTIQGKRTQEDMAELLGITREAYSKYVGSRASQVPIRFLPKLAKIGAVSLEWLIEGERAAKPETLKKPSAKAPKRKAG